MLFSPVYMACRSSAGEDCDHALCFGLISFQSYTREKIEIQRGQVTCPSSRGHFGSRSQLPFIAALGLPFSVSAIPNLPL